MNVRPRSLRALTPALAAFAAAALLAGASPASAPLPQEEALRARILEIVKEECGKAFERHGGGVLTADQITAAIVPMIADEVTRRAVPLILERKRDEAGAADPALAEVGGKPIRVSDVRIELARLPAAARRAALTPDKLVAFLEETLIPKRLLLARAAEKRLAENPDVKRQLAVAFENLLVEHFLKSRSEDLRGRLATRFTEAETRDYYQNNLERLYQIPPRVTLAHVVKRFPPGDERKKAAALEEMKRALADLDEGVTFETVARKYSDDPKIILGKFRKDEAANDPVVRRGLSLMLGRHSEIVEGDDGWHIVMVREMEEARTIPYEEVRKNIVVSLSNERLAGEVERWVRDLRRSHEVRIFEALVTAEAGLLLPDALPRDPSPAGGTAAKAGGGDAAPKPEAKGAPKSPAKGDRAAKRGKERAKGREREKEQGRRGDAEPERKAPPKDPNLDVLAMVDGEPVLRRDFNEYLEQVPGRFAELVTSPEGRLSIVERLVNKRVILKTARAEGFDGDPGFLDAYRDLEAKILSKNLVIDEVAQKVAVTDKEIDDYFAKHPDEVKARHILVTVPEGVPPEAEAEARARAATVLERAKAGEDFAALAREFSDDPSRVDGGYLGYFSDDMMVEAFSRQAFAMATGEVSPLVRTPYGFHIIKVEDRRPRPRDAEARRHVRDRVLGPVKQAEAFRAYVDGLRARARAKVDRAAVAAALKGGLLEK